MKELDVVLLTESRYENPTEINDYIANILLEDKILTEALVSKGLSVNRVDWQRNNFDWESASIIIIRTTWDYHEKRSEFLSFLENYKDKVKFINPVETLIWNMDKHYLYDLSLKDVPVTKSVFIEKGTNSSLKKAFDDLEVDEIVLKPCISSTARNTFRISRDEVEKYEPIFKDLLKEESMIVQEFLYSILDQGEISLMYFNGKYSHAILKKAKLGDFRVQDDFGGTVHDYSASAEEIAFGLKVLENIHALPLYARVDICRDNNERIVLGELELIEPELWFRNKPDSAAILATAISNMIN